MRGVGVALVQMKMSESFEENAARGLEAMRLARRRGASIVCFPELQFQRFFPRLRRLGRLSVRALSPASPVIKEFRRVAADLKVVCILNFYEKSRGRYYDSSPVIDADGTLLGVSRMVHIVQMKHFYERDYYSPSGTGFKVYDTKFARLGVVICYDRHFPESMRLMALDGAQIVFVPSANLEGEPLELFEWEMRVAAYHNGFFVAMANRVGREGDVCFCGGSLVAGPSGAVVERGDDRERLVVARLDPGQVAQARRERPFLSLRQPHHYRRLSR